MRGVDLSDLMGEMSLRPGTWFHLLEADTKFSPDGFVTRTSFPMDGSPAVGESSPPNEDASPQRSVDRLGVEPEELLGGQADG